MRVYRSGFTLLELLIVIILIGLMAAIAYPRLRGTTTGMSVRSARQTTTVRTNVARIDVVVRAQTAAPVALSGGDRSYLRDSLAFTVSRRNRQ